MSPTWKGHGSRGTKVAWEENSESTPRNSKFHSINVRDTHAWKLLEEKMRHCLDFMEMIALMKPKTSTWKDWINTLLNTKTIITDENKLDLGILMAGAIQKNPDIEIGELLDILKAHAELADLENRDSEDDVGSDETAKAYVPGTHNPFGQVITP